MITQHQSYLIALLIVLLASDPVPALDEVKGGTVTNLSQYNEKMAVTARKIVEFKAGLKESSDPVALAIDMAKESDPLCVSAAVPVFRSHWVDPRSEAALSDIANRGPLMVSDGVITVSGVAQSALCEVQARKQFAEIIRDKDVPQDQRTAVSAYCRNHPEMFSDDGEQYALKKLCVDVLIKYGGPEDVEFVIAAGLFNTDYVRTRLTDIIAYSRLLGPEKAMNLPRLQDELVRTGDKRVLPLLEEWLDKATQPDHKRSIEQAISKLRGKDLR